MKIMKKIILLFLLLTSSYVFGQSAGTYNGIISFLHQTHPEISTENKLIALCVWSSDNAGSRETNKAFKGLHDTYQGAILKDARKGMIFISVSADRNEMTYTIALQKDGIRDCVTYCDFKGPQDGLLKSLELGTATNVVYSGKGELFFKNLDQTNAKSSIISLLTR
jgi:hypothetical protein